MGRCSTASGRLALVPPSCLAAWAKRIGELPLGVGGRYNNSLLTPRDWTSHFKNVLHRAMLTRSVTTQEPCRCCGYARENLQHFPTCSACACIFEDLRKMTGLPELQSEMEKERFGLFALHPEGRVEGGWMNLHLLIWKQLIALLVRIEEEGEKFDASKVWAPAWIRFEKKVLAHKEKIDIEVRRSVSRGEPVRNMRKKSRPIAPLARYEEGGELIWDEDLVKKVRELGRLSKGGGAGGRRTS